MRDGGKRRDRERDRERRDAELLGASLVLLPRLSRGVPRELLKLFRRPVVRWASQFMDALGPALVSAPQDFRFTAGAVAFALTGSSDHALNRQAFNLVTFEFATPHVALIDEEIIADAMLGSGEHWRPFAQFLQPGPNQLLQVTVRNNVAIPIDISLVLWVVTESPES